MMPGEVVRPAFQGALVARFWSVIGRCSPVAAVVLFGLAGCQPALNWREVRLPGAGFAMMPCKPDATRRQVPLGGHAVEVQLLTCNAADATFALAIAQLPVGASLQVAQQHWQRSLLVHLKARDVTDLTAAAGLPDRVGLSGMGIRPESGNAIAVVAYWFIQGQHLVHAAIYVDNPSGKPVAQLLGADLQEPFIGGVRPQP